MVNLDSGSDDDIHWVTHWIDGIDGPTAVNFDMYGLDPLI